MNHLPLLWIHGWGMHAGIWQAIRRQWPSESTLALDLPGYGGIPAVNGGLDDLVHDVLHRAPEYFDVCGWSLGGLLAQRMALLAPHRIRRIALIGATPCFTTRKRWNCGIEPAVLTAFAAELAHAYEPTLKRFLALQVHGDTAARASLALLRTQLFARGRPDADVLQQGLDILLETDLRAELPKLQQPLLLIQGTRDSLTPLCAAEWLSRQIAGSRLVAVAGAAHAPFLSHEAQCVVALREFLSDKPLDPPSPAIARREDAHAK